MAKKNYEILEIVWKPEFTFSRIVELYYEDRVDVNKLEANNDMITESIKKVISLLSMYHLGYETGLTKQKIQTDLEYAARLAEIYFDDIWWRDLIIPSVAKEDMENLNLLHKIALDKTHENRELEWYNPMRYGFFLNAFLNRWEEIAKICSWFDTTIEPEYQAGLLEDEYMQLFVCIACSFSTTKHDITELLAKVKKCRTKRPKLLCAAWEAAMKADQQAFNKAFPATIENFLSKSEKIANFLNYLAFDQSTIWMIAEKNGLTMPELSEKMKAVIVTRESIGLA
jgi:hypothetical protein